MGNKGWAFVVGAIVGAGAILVASLKNHIDAPYILGYIGGFLLSIGFFSLIAYAIISAVAKNDSNKTKWKKSIIIAFVLCVILLIISQVAKVK